jgi:hypothetical protein
VKFVTTAEYSLLLSLAGNFLKIRPGLEVTISDGGVLSVKGNDSSPTLVVPPTGWVQLARATKGGELLP